ncbi:hypothetical protein B0H11DRAFT_1910227 [Mycena galericulata]|nr:hypothetical protein B0H11DRAFT_1910227 [Mycena galericulata]
MLAGDCPLSFDFETALDRGATPGEDTLEMQASRLYGGVFAGVCPTVYIPPSDIIDSEGGYNDSSSCNATLSVGHEVIPVLVADPDDFSYRGPSAFLASQSFEYHDSYQLSRSTVRWGRMEEGCVDPALILGAESTGAGYKVCGDIARHSQKVSRGQGKRLRSPLHRSRSTVTARCLEGRYSRNCSVSTPEADLAPVTEVASLCAGTVLPTFAVPTHGWSLTLGAKMFPEQYRYLLEEGCTPVGEGCPAILARSDSLIRHLKTRGGGRCMGASAARKAFLISFNELPEVLRMKLECIDRPSAKARLNRNFQEKNVRGCLLSRECVAVTLGLYDTSTRILSVIGCCSDGPSITLSDLLAEFRRKLGSLSGTIVILA